MTLVKWKKPSSNGQLNKQLIYHSPFEDLFRDFFPAGVIGPSPYFTPAANILDEEQEYGIELAVPGFEKNDFKILLEGQLLSILGDHSDEKNNNGNVQHKEFSRQSFRREFTLPDNIQEEAVRACYENGILKISIPKTDAKTAKIVTVS